MYVCQAVASCSTGWVNHFWTSGRMQEHHLSEYLLRMVVVVDDVVVRAKFLVPAVVAVFHTALGCCDGSLSGRD